jgi:hypothetical protein
MRISLLAAGVAAALVLLCPDTAAANGGYPLLWHEWFHDWESAILTIVLGLAVETYCVSLVTKRTLAKSAGLTLAINVLSAIIGEIFYLAIFVVSSLPAGVLARYIPALMGLPATSLVENIQTIFESFILSMGLGLFSVYIEGHLLKRFLRLSFRRSGWMILWAANVISNFFLVMSSTFARWT